MNKVLALVLIGFAITYGTPAARVLNAGLKEELVCEGKKSIISCKTGHTITVVEANYGRFDTTRCFHESINTTNCSSSSSTRTIKISCNRRRSCSLFASNSVFGDPCRGTYKYIRVLFKCRKSIYNRVVLCEGSRRSIKCPTGQVIHIYSANYGRRDRNTCPSQWIRTITCSARKSYNILQGQCHYKNSCMLHASNFVYGDPCRGTYKYLSVSYRCMKPRHKDVVVCEGRRHLIRCPSGKRIRIKYANYGRTDASTCPHSSIKSIRCYAPNSKSKVAASCNGKPKCNLTPINSVFGDPCVGTYKYLRVYYECI